MPFTDLSRSRGTQFKPLSKVAFFIFVCNFLILLVLGAKHVESPFIEFGQICTVLYFAYFFIIIPLISLFENSLTVLTSVEIEDYLNIKMPAVMHSCISCNWHGHITFTNEWVWVPRGPCKPTPIPRIPCPNYCLNKNHQPCYDVPAMSIDEWRKKYGLKCPLKTLSVSGKITSYSDLYEDWSPFHPNNKNKRDRDGSDRDGPDKNGPSGASSSEASSGASNKASSGASNQANTNSRIIATIGVSLLFLISLTIVGLALLELKTITSNFTLQTILLDAPRPWGIYFQDSATPQMEALVELHNIIFFYLVIILFTVGWLLVSIVKNYSNTEAPITHKYLSHGTLIELIWTITPALLLILIAFPSFKLLYLMDEVSDPSMAVLAEGFFTGDLKLHILNKIKDTSLTGEKNNTLVPKLAQVQSTSFLSTRYTKHNFTFFTKPVFFHLKMKMKKMSI